MRLLRRTAPIAAALAAVIAFTACGGESSSSSAVNDALASAKTAACSALSSLEGDLEQAQTDGGEQLATKAETLSSGLTTAAGALQAVGADDSVVSGLQDLASDLGSMATSTPADIQSQAAAAATKVESAKSSLSCP